MHIFDRELVRAHRDRAAPVYDDHAFLFMEGAERLCDRLADIKREFPKALDLGCHAGEVGSALLGTQKVQSMFQADFSAAFAAGARNKNGLPTIAGDEETLPFAVGSLDLVLSNLSLHWVNDLPGTLSQIRMALAPDGLLLASVFGVETLRELRDSLAKAEIELEGGLSPRVSPFADVRDLGGLLQRAGFALPVVDTETITVRYADPFRLLHDLRGMGESNAVLERRRTPMRRSTLMAGMSNYLEMYADEDGRVPATFQILTMTAWAPHASQQKPLQPGSASSRLADALGTDEVSLGEKARPNKP